MIPWFKNVKPHNDIRDGRLDESIFAANLSEVALGTGREIYTNPEMFFSKTFFTSGIKNIAKRVIHGLNGGQDSDNRVISLQTGFGGGKTHTLISLYHLAKWGKKVLKSDSTEELLEITGKPEFDTANVAVFTNNTNDPAQGRKVEGIHIRTIWGEIAFQLGGKETYELIRTNDEKLTAPKGLFKSVLEESKPSLILIDELADYCISASGIKVGASNLSDQTISFLQELTEAVAGTDNTVMIATLPASAKELASSPVAASILTALENRIIRVGANIKPVEDEEIFEVVRRRLFEDLGDLKVIEDVVSEYMHMYQGHLQEVPDYALKSEYSAKMKKSYPFHPELIDIFRLRWASNPYFQRTRGVLRLLAAIVSDLWKRRQSLSGNNALIHTSDIILSNVEPLTNQISSLFGANYDAVISSDISGNASNAAHIDTNVKTLGDYNLTQGVATTILLATFGSQGQNKGIAVDELKLSMLKPDTFNHNDINGALDRLEDAAHYLYYSSTGQKKYWFHTKPNINILINQAKGEIKTPVLNAEILKRLAERSKHVTRFNILIDPGQDIPEQTKPTIIILSPQYCSRPESINTKTAQLIEKLATKKGSGERIYRNTILFLICSEIGLTKLHSDIREFLACQKISIDYTGQLEKDQKDELKRKSDEAAKQIESSIITAYSLLLKFSSKNGIDKLNITQFKDTIERQISDVLLETLKSEEWLLESVGMNTLKNNNLLPTVESPVRTKDIYEAFLRFDDKPMITGIEAIQNSLQRYCSNGEIAIAAGDERNFTNIFYKQTIPLFNVSDPTYWVVDKSLYKPDVSVEGNDAVTGVVDDSGSGGGAAGVDAGIDGDAGNKVKVFRSIHISGKVPFENYNQIFTSFIMPLKDNQVEIEIKIKGKSTKAKQITENSQEYKIIKESAKQLGLDLEEE